MEYYFRLLFFRAPNLGHPYHNFRHMSHVFWLCGDACAFYRTTLTPRQMRNLLIAAIFHDWGHSGKLGNDAENIARALEALDKYILPEDRPYFDEIAAIIRGTEYPHTVPADELDLCGLILRDADVSQGLSVAWIHQVIRGLAAEWQKEPIAVLRTQEPFLSSLTFHTEWAKYNFPEDSLYAKIIEAKELLEILEREPLP